MVPISGVVYLCVSLRKSHLSFGHVVQFPLYFKGDDIHTVIDLEDLAVISSESHSLLYLRAQWSIQTPSYASATSILTVSYRSFFGSGSTPPTASTSPASTCPYSLTRLGSIR